MKRGKSETLALTTDTKLKEIIRSLWRENAALYDEKYNRDPELDAFGLPIDPLVRSSIAETVRHGLYLGQSNLIEGNRSTAIGQGLNTKSFMEIVMGAYNLIPTGQNPDEWIPTDLLLSLGNGLDDLNRSNVFEIFKNGFFKFLQSIKIGAAPALGVGEIREDGTLQWTPAAGLEEWKTDHWEAVSHPPVTIAAESVGKLNIGADQVLSIIPDPELKDGLISGGLVTWVEGYTYLISAAIYRYLGVVSTTPGATVTLDASDVTDPRIDEIALTFGIGFEILTGIAAVNPIKPQVDVATQIELTNILVPANSTEPTGVTEDLIYDENVEWAHSEFGVVVDYDSIIAPFHGAKCIDVGTIGNNDTLTLTAATPLNVADYEMLSFLLKLKAVASTKNAIYVQFRLAGIAVTQELPINWLITDIVNWQSVAMVLADFTFSATTFDSIRIRWSRVQGTTEHAGFYLDYIKLQKGVVAPVFTDTIEMTGDVTGTGKTGTPFETTLKNVITAGTFGSATKTVTITVDAKGRVIAVTENEIVGGGGTDGREIELSTSGGYVVWRYVGDVSWTNLFLIPTNGTDGRGITSVTLTNTVGLVKTYTILYTDSTTSTFDVTDGADGASGGSPIEVTGLTLTSGSWTLVSGFYEYDLANVNITATAAVDVIPARADIAIVKAADIMPETLSSAGSVKLYATNAPTGNIGVTIIITEVL